MNKVLGSEPRDQFRNFSSKIGTPGIDTGTSESSTHSTERGVTKSSNKNIKIRSNIVSLIRLEKFFSLKLLEL